MLAATARNTSGLQADAFGIKFGMFLQLQVQVVSLMSEPWQYNYTLCPKKTCDYIFYNNFNKRCPITIIFGTVSSKSMRHQKMVSFPTSPI